MCTWSFKASESLIQDLKYTRHLTTAVNQLMKASELHKHACGEAAINSWLWQRTRARREWGWDLVPGTRLPNRMTHTTMVKHSTGHFPSAHYFKIFILLKCNKTESSSLTITAMWNIGQAGFWGIIKWLQPPPTSSPFCFSLSLPPLHTNRNTYSNTLWLLWNISSMTEILWLLFS